MNQKARRDEPGEIGERGWHRSYVSGVPKSIEFEEITMPEVLTRTAGKFPKRTALLFMGKEISYAKLEHSANRFANALLALGVKRADKVALLLPNIPNIVIAYYGTWRAGAIPVPNNPMYTERELAIFPFFHLAGFTAVMIAAVKMGWTAILVPRPEPRAVLDMMIKYKATVIPAVPTIYVGLLGLPEFKKKVPKMYEFVGSLPKSSVGKVLRRELREMDLKKNRK